MLLKSYPEAVNMIKYRLKHCKHYENNDIKNISEQSESSLATHDTFVSFAFQNDRQDSQITMMEYAHEFNPMYGVI